MSNASPIIARFGHADIGHLAAQIEDLAWLAMPVANGLKMLSGWRLNKPMENWVPDDFYSADGIVADEEAFRAHVEDIAQHRRELAALPRPETAGNRWMPWGQSQQSFCYVDGITLHSTASHGGFHLTPERNLEMCDALRNVDGWYEEDGEWAKVAETFPDLFTARERKQASRTLCNDYPDYWEASRVVQLPPGQAS